jgi:hypothetical protein
MTFILTDDSGLKLVYSQPASVRGHMHIAGAGFDPNAYGDLQNWYEPTIGKAADAGGVALWNDQKSGHHVSQGAAGSRPDDGSESDECIEFNAANGDQLTSDTACRVGGADFTIVMDVLFKDDALKGLLSVDDGASPAFVLNYWKGVTGLGVRTYNPVDGYQGISAEPNLAAGEWHQLAIRYKHSTTTLELFANNALVASSDARTVSPGTDRFRIATTTGDSGNANMKVGRILTYSSRVDDAGLAAIHAQKHG